MKKPWLDKKISMMHRLNILRIASEQHGNALIIYSRKKYGKSLVKSARARDEFLPKI